MPPDVLLLLARRELDREWDVNGASRCEKATRGVGQLSTGGMNTPGDY